MRPGRRSGGGGWTYRPFAAGDDGAVASFDDAGDEPVVVGFRLRTGTRRGRGRVRLRCREFFGGDHGAVDVGGLPKSDSAASEPVFGWSRPGSPCGTVVPRGVKRRAVACSHAAYRPSTGVVRISAGKLLGSTRWSLTMIRSATRRLLGVRSRPTTGRDAALRRDVASGTGDDEGSSDPLLLVRQGRGRSWLSGCRACPVGLPLHGVTWPSLVDSRVHDRANPSSPAQTKPVLVAGSLGPTVGGDHLAGVTAPGRDTKFLLIVSVGSVEPWLSAGAGVGVAVGHAARSIRGDHALSAR